MVEKRKTVYHKQNILIPSVTKKLDEAEQIAAKHFIETISLE
jgi:hypothetical protein